MKRSTAPLISEAHKYLGDQISSRLTNTQRAPELLEQFVSGNFRIVNPDTGETSISPKYFTTSSSGKIIENTGGIISGVSSTVKHVEAILGKIIPGNQKKDTVICQLPSLSQRLTIAYANDACLDHAEDIDGITNRGDAYQFRMFLDDGRRPSRESSYERVRSESDALLRVLDAGLELYQQEIDTKEKSKITLAYTELEEMGIIEATESGGYIICGMYTAISSHDTLRLFLENSGIHLGKSMDKNDRGFEIAFLRIVNEFFEKHGNLSHYQREALINLNSSELYARKRRNAELRKLMQQGIVERLDGGAFKISGLFLSGNTLLWKNGAHIEDIELSPDDDFSIAFRIMVDAIKEEHNLNTNEVNELIKLGDENLYYSALRILT